MAVFTPEDLYNAVQGDLEAFLEVSGQSHDTIRECRLAFSELVLTPQSICNVLVALKRNEVSPQLVQLVQQWASFVRRGFVSRWQTCETNVHEHQRPMTPIEIDYEAAFEDEIVEVISRLDEIGDIIDGEITVDEMNNWIDSFICMDKAQEISRHSHNK